MAWTTPATWIAGEVLTAAQLNTQVRDNLREIGQTAGVAAAWTDFTPTLSGGWALGNSTYTARYIRTGRKIEFYAKISIGSSATKGTTLTAALPVASQGDFSAVPGGLTASFADTGTAGYSGFVIASSTTAVTLGSGFLVATDRIQIGNITSTFPFTWVTGDEIRYGGVYEAAT